MRRQNKVAWIKIPTYRKPHTYLNMNVGGEINHMFPINSFTWPN